MTAAKIEFHPIAELFPSMTAAELGGLVADIEAHGLLEPIVLLDGKVVDGRNSYHACLAAGVKPTYRTVEFGSEEAAITFVISANLHRRHLSGKEKRAIINKLLKANPERSDRQIAADIGADNKTVASVRTEAEATEEIPHTNKRKGRDGRLRPVRKSPEPKVQPAMSPTERALDLVTHKLDTIEGKVPTERPPRVAEQPSTAPSEKSPGDGKDDPAASDLSDEEKEEAEFKVWLDAGDKAQKASAHYLDEFTASCRAYLPKITEESHREKARALINKLISKTPAKPHVEDHGAATPQDVGPYSRAETDRLRARVDELGAENRWLQIENVGLKNEVSELKARKA